LTYSPYRDKSVGGEAFHNATARLSAGDRVQAVKADARLHTERPLAGVYG